ncbi:MAG: efflux RND transporter periplasmic adaptor subunit, partial [Burkholderiales bacterium]|nr:efflux RND transporter periplasmic adaptor subunit [Burkholderiales bacterium]
MKLWIKRTAIAASVLAVVTGGGWLYLQKNPRPEEPKFRTAQVDFGAITQVVLATGTLQPVITVNVGTQVSGTVL